MVQSPAIADITSSDPGAPSVDDLLAECLSLPEAERDAAVDAACAAHPSRAEELRRRVELLSASGVLDEPVDYRNAVPDQLGDFRIVRELSSGGMGLVYLAVQGSMQREVALKLVRPERLLFAETRRRFEREARVIARLNHPGIVPVYAFGEEKGIPYLAMEYVEGCTLADALRALPHMPPERLRGSHLLAVLAGCGQPSDVARALCEGPWHRVSLRIAARIAAALEHAHERGVVHRDVKPSNVMLAPDGRVMLLDFGLARADGAGELTVSGAQPGSLPYMAPEQVRGESPAAHTDVYGLGVTLYEMLALNLPYWDESSEGLRRKILEARPNALRQRNRALDRDIETVCLTAMDESASRRYGSAAKFADDLHNLLEHRGIAARPAGPLLRIRRLAQRRPATSVAVVGAALVALAVPVAINHGIAAERDRAVRRGYAANVIAAGYALGSHNSAAARQHLERCPEELRGFEWHHLSLHCDQSERQFPDLEGSDIRFLGDGSRFAVVLASGELVIAGTADGQVLWRQSGTVDVMDTSPDRTRLAFIHDGRVRLIDALTARPLGEFDNPDGVRFRYLRFSADGRTLVASARGVCCVFDATSGRLRYAPTRLAGGYCAGITADGSHGLFVFWRSGEPSYDPRTEIRDLANAGALVRVLDPDDFANCSAVSPDETYVATGMGRGGRIKLFDLASGQALWTVTAHQERAITSLRFDADRRWLVSAGTDSAIEVRDVTNGASVATLLGHESRVFSADIDPSGERIASVAMYRGARIWRWHRLPQRSDIAGHDSPALGMRWVAGGAQLLTVADRGAIGRWDTTNAVSVGEVRTDGRLSDGAFSPDGAVLATVSDRARESVLLWDLASDEVVARLDAPGYRHLSGDVAFSSDGGLLALASGADAIRIWDVATRTPVLRIDDSERLTVSVAFSPRAATLWSGSKDARILVHDTRTGNLIRTLSARGPVMSLIFGPDGETVWVGEGHDIVVRDARDGEVLKVLTAHQGSVHSLHFAPDAHRLVSASHDGSVRIWDPETGEDLLVLRADGQWMYEARFSPDSSRVAAVGESGAVTIWESRR